MEIDKPIEYQSFTTRQGVLGLCIILAILFLFVVKLIPEMIKGLDGVELFALIVPGAFALLFIFALIMVIKNIRTGLRTIRISNNSVTLIYPDDVVEIGKSQIYELKTKRRIDDGKKKGRVTFEGSDGKKYSLGFTFIKTNGLAAFEWFEELEKQQKQQTGEL